MSFELSPDSTCAKIAQFAKDGILYAKDDRKRIGDNALVALSLLIAESKPKEKDIITKVIINLINKDNWIQ